MELKIFKIWKFFEERMHIMQGNSRRKVPWPKKIVAEEFRELRNVVLEETGENKIVRDIH